MNFEEQKNLLVRYERIKKEMLDNRNPDAVIERICQVQEITVEDFKSRKRQEPIVTARIVAAQFFVSQGFTLKAAAALIGDAKEDHSTIIYYGKRLKSPQVRNLRKKLGLI